MTYNIIILSDTTINPNLSLSAHVLCMKLEWTLSMTLEKKLIVTEIRKLK